MIKSGLRGEKEARIIPVVDFKQREDLQMYGQLPDYEEFQRYYLGIYSEVSQIDAKIYADFHNPS